MADLLRSECILQSNLNNMFTILMSICDSDTKNQGENLWMGTADAFRYPEMLDFWLGERTHAKSGRFPDVSKTGNWMDVAHYTQIVWPTTKQVGCALAKNASDEFGDSA